MLILFTRCALSVHSKQIGSLDDCKLLQEDLDNVVNWSKSNNVKHRSELVIHMHRLDDLLQELPNFLCATLRHPGKSNTRQRFECYDIWRSQLVAPYLYLYGCCVFFKRETRMSYWPLTNRFHGPCLEKAAYRDVPHLSTTDMERYIILEVWKILNGESLIDIGMYFRDTSRRGTIAVPALLDKRSSQRNQSLYDGSFVVLRVRVWNVVLAEIKPL